MRTIKHNPYNNVSWNSQLKGEFHTHTSESDGSNSVQEMVSEYASLGFDVVAITDHDFIGGNTPTWPWTDYGVNPNDYDIVPIMGNELSWYLGPYDPNNQHHIVSLFNDYGGHVDGNEHESLQEVGDRNGIAFFAHPNNEQFKPPEAYDFEWYIQFYQQYPHLLGQEIGGSHDLIWDYVLEKLAPTCRNIYGIKTSDAHSIASIGSSFTLILAEKDETSIREALEKGHFVAGYGRTPPSIQSLTIDKANNVISIIATNYTEIKWYVNGVMVATGDSYDYSKLLLDSFYVRAQVWRSGANLWLNPILLGDGRWNASDGVWKTGVFTTGQFD
jgi:hypothetical protein